MYHKYGLPQAGISAQELSEDRLGKRGYSQHKYTPGLWTHKSRSFVFSLIVDVFGVKYIRTEYAQHLIDALGDYEMEIDRK